MSKSSKVPARRPATVPEPWQAWGTTARYVIIRLALIVPSIVFAWLVFGFHLRQSHRPPYRAVPLNTAQLGNTSRPKVGAMVRMG
jgi:hypothetical protein